MDLFLFFHSLSSFAKPTHTHTHTHTGLYTHTHTHTHTHTLLILLSDHHQGTHLHCNYIICFSPFFLLKLFVLFIRDVSPPLLFFAFRFFKNYFPLIFEKSPTKNKQQQQQKSRSLVPPLSCRKSSSSFISGRSSKAGSLRTVLEI